MKELENKIIESANTVPLYNGYGYRIINDLMRRIARIMKYEIYTYRNGHWSFKNPEDRERVCKIIEGMENKGIIKVSKSGQAYKVLENR